MIEFLLALIENISVASQVILVFGTIVVALISFGCFLEMGQPPTKHWRRLSPWAILLICLSIIPHPEQLWKVRISLIKYQLASPENIQQGAAAITEIAKKLECKYLGCEEKK